MPLETGRAFHGFACLCPAGCAGVGTVADTPMTQHPPTHGRAARAAGCRSHSRRLGAALAREGGRQPELSRVRLPAVRGCDAGEGAGW